MKKVICILSIFILMISLIGCSNGSNGQDKKFIKAVEKGLDNRWTYLETKEYQNLNEKEGLEKAIDKELEKIKGFKNAEFDNPELGKLALDYITSVEAQKEALKYYNNAEKYYNKWDKAYDKRSECIVTLVEKYGLKVDEEGYKDLKDNAQVVKEENKINDALDKEMKKVEFEMVSNEYGWKKYEAIVQNTTGAEIQDFYLDISLNH